MYKINYIISFVRAVVKRLTKQKAISAAPSKPCGIFALLHFLFELF